MRIQVRKWGNSPSTRIPAPILVAAALRIGQDVDSRKEDGRIGIAPVAATSYDLDALQDAMTPETFPDDTDFGAPAGKETW